MGIVSVAESEGANVCLYVVGGGLSLQSLFTAAHVGNF